jgi:hypothetical protein
LFERPLGLLSRVNVDQRATQAGRRAACAAVDHGRAGHHPARATVARDNAVVGLEQRCIAAYVSAELGPHACLVVVVNGTEPGIRGQHAARETKVPAIAEPGFKVHLVAADVPVPETHPRGLHDQLMKRFTCLQVARYLLRQR